MRRKTLFALLSLCLALNAAAFDIEVPQQGGYSLYFNIMSREDNLVEVTCPSPQDGSTWSGYTAPSGVLSIPALVEHEGIGYVVTAIGDRAFSGCTAITALNLPSTLTQIGAYAFSQCYGIQGTVTIGERVKSIGRSAFYGCSSLTGLQFDAMECEVMGGSISATAFGGCRSLVRLTLGPKVKRIPDYAFYGMDQLSSEWQLPSSLEYVGEYAFAYCSKLRGTAVVPEGVRTIGPCAFMQCHSLYGLELPSRLARIDQRAFCQCINLRRVHVAALLPPTLGDDVFLGIAADALLQLPCASESRYRQHSQWNTFRTLQPTGPCTVDIRASVNNPAYGSVLGAGSYRIGETATLVAVCTAGHSFLGWADGNTQNPRPVVVTDTGTFTALLQPNEVEYIHDTTYMDGEKIRTEYYEVNDVAQPISSQDRIVYNRQKQRIEIDLPKRSLVNIDLYNAAGQCISSGLPRNGHINLGRYPTGNYMIRVTTLTERHILRFFHTKNK